MEPLPLRTLWVRLALPVALVGLLASACTTVRTIDASPPQAGLSLSPSPTPTPSIVIPTSPIRRSPTVDTGIPAPLPGEPIPAPLPTETPSDDTTGETGVVKEGAKGVVPCGRIERQTISGVDTTTKWTCYDITGRTLRALNKQANQKGPKVDGSRAVAATQWKLSWSFTTSENPDGCDLVGPNAKADITYIYPRVTNEDPEATIQAWENFMNEEVIPHEESHARIAREGGAKIVTVLGRTKSAPTCEKVKKAADAAARDVADATEKRQNDFDKKEAHR